MSDTLTADGVLAMARDFDSGVDIDNRATPEPQTEAQTPEASSPVEDSASTESEVVADVVQPQHGLDAVDAEIRPELAERHVLGAVTLVVAVGLGLVQIVQRTAVDRAAEAAFHAGPVLVEVLGVEPLGPGRLLVVLRAHGAEQAARLVEKRRAGHRQGALRRRPDRLCRRHNTATGQRCGGSYRTRYRSIAGGDRLHQGRRSAGSEVEGPDRDERSGAGLHLLAQHGPRETKGEDWLRKFYVGQEPQIIRDRRQAIDGKDGFRAERNRTRRRR